MNTCPDCQDTQKQVKAGFNRSGSQRYRWIARHLGVDHVTVMFSVSAVAILAAAERLW